MHVKGISYTTRLTGEEIRKNSGFMEKRTGISKKNGRRGK